MKRYLSRARFEGVEVADSDYADLTTLRREENSEIQSVKRDFESDVQVLKQQTSTVISALQSIRDAELADLNATYESAVSHYLSEYEFPFPDEFYEIMSEVWAQYRSDCSGPHQHYETAVATVYNQYDGEYSSLSRARDQTIEYIEDSYTPLIDQILNAIYTIPIHMLNNKPGACDVCRELDKAASTLSVLTAKGYIPPFHINCRCYITVDGYVVMSGITPFEITGLL